jgi:hypothetical protein
VCCLPALSHSRSSGLEAVRRATTRCAEEGLVRAGGRVGENEGAGRGWSGMRGQGGGVGAPAACGRKAGVLFSLNLLPLLQLSQGVVVNLGGVRSARKTKVETLRSKHYLAGCMPRLNLGLQLLL